jgi:murein DD-endopeptidase MepM/ murein hydrolase activator NlpD
MALVSGFSQSTKDLLGQTQSIRSSLLTTRKSFNTINKVFERRTRIKATIFKNRKVQNDRKLEALARKEQRDASQAVKFTIARNPSPRTVLQRSGKNFLGRLMDFVSSLAIGWILGNLPTWIKWGEAFIKRVGKVINALSSFTQTVVGFVKTLATNLGTIIGQIASFKFSELPGTVNNAMNDLNLQFQAMQNEFEKGFALFDQPLIDESELSLPEQEAQTPQQQSGASVSPGTPGAQFGPSMTATGGAAASPYIYSGYRTANRPRHNGIDISGGPWQSGAPISVVKPGTVAHVGNHGNDSWGKFVVIKHDDGTYSLYGHLSQINVRQGEKIENKSGAAKVIGKVGSTGRSEGPHLHFELGTGWNGGTLTGHMNPSGYIDSYTRVGGNVKTTAAAVTAQPQQTLMGQPAPTGGTLSTDQLVALAKQVGFNQQNAVIAAAVAKAESGGGSGKLNNNPKTGDLSYGLWQINMIGRMGPERLKQFGISSYEQLYDPLTNARAAFILSGGSNFKPWSVYKSGKYQSFLPEAQKAAGVSPAQFNSAQQRNIPGSITPTNEGEVVFAEFPASGVSVSPGAGGGYSGGGGGGGPSFSPPQQSESDVLNNFIKNKLLVELSYL